MYSTLQHHVSGILYTDLMFAVLHEAKYREESTNSIQFTLGVAEHRPCMRNP